MPLWQNDITRKKMHLKTYRKGHQCLAEKHLAACTFWDRTWGKNASAENTPLYLPNEIPGLWVDRNLVLALWRDFSTLQVY